MQAPLLCMSSQLAVGLHSEEGNEMYYDFDNYKYRSTPPPAEVWLK